MARDPLVDDDDFEDDELPTGSVPGSSDWHYDKAAGYLEAADMDWDRTGHGDGPKEALVQSSAAAALSQAHLAWAQHLERQGE